MERLRTVQRLAAQLFELWSLRRKVCLIMLPVASQPQVTLPRSLDLSWIKACIMSFSEDLPEEAKDVEISDDKGAMVGVKKILPAIPPCCIYY
ncbi:hypothetical protein MKX03_004234 [Papaver bracteatum]|nr:hypothetical protein MKX03_004234 [Papaver bracteatum]